MGSNPIGQLARGEEHERNQPTQIKIRSGSAQQSDQTSFCPVYNGDYVLVTAPASVASSIDFDPPMSTQKRRALRTAAYSSATKVLMAFDTPFWERENKYKGGSTLTDLHVRQIYYPQAGMNPNSTLHLIVASYTWGRDSGRFNGMSHDHIIRECLQAGNFPLGGRRSP